ncbi:MAG TPA: hypothetical protein VFQ51_12650, partial [Vicinamibacteria bacterium]|nr:hypothetical protein [Vicinamibacteria bacterium]
MRELVAQLVIGTFVFQSTVPPSAMGNRPLPLPAHGLGATARSLSESEPVREARQDARIGTTRPIDAAVPGAQPLDLREWSAEGAPDPEAWSINESGTAAESNAPEADAFLVSPTSLATVTLQGTLSLPVASGPQTAGVVLGYRAPLHGNGTPQRDYLLLSWQRPGIPNPEIRGEWLLSRVRPGMQEPEVLSQVG